MRFGLLFNILSVFLTVFLLFCQDMSGAENDRVQRILLIDSYSTSDAWTENLRHGIREFLTQHHKIVNYENYELGVRFQQGVVPAKGDIEALRVKLSMTHYDLIIVSNNPAADLFLEDIIPIPPKTPVLISSYNGPLLERIAPGKEITGIETPVSLWDNIKLAQKLFPHLKLITVLVEASADGIMMEKTFWRYVEKYQPKGVKIQLLDGSRYTTPVMLEKVSTLPADSLLFYHSWSSLKETTHENNYTILSKLRESFPGFILGEHYAYLRLGSAGGYVSSGEEQGRHAAKLALRLLSGEPASKIRAEKGTTQLILDYQQLKKFDIQPALIPPEALLFNTPPDIFIQYRTGLIVGIICILASLLILLFYHMYRRKTLRRMSSMLSHLPLRLGVVDSNGKFLYHHLPDSVHPDTYKDMQDINQLPFEIRELFIETTKKVQANGRKVELDYELHGQRRHANFMLLDSSAGFGGKVVMWTSADVSDLYQANTSISQVAEHFKLTLESIGDGVIATDEQGKITLINSVASKLTGFPVKEAVGQHVNKIFNIVSYITDKPVESPLQKALTTGEVVQLANHTDLISRTGTRLHIADSAAPIKTARGEISGGVLVFRDVTEEYRQRDHMRMHSVVLKNASEIARFIYFCCNEKGEVIYTTANTLKHGEVIPFNQWVAPEEYPHFLKGWNQLFTGGKSEFHEIYSSVSDNERNYFEIRAESVLNETSRKVEYIGVIQDITQAKRNEIQFRDNLKLLETIMNNLPGYVFVKEVEDGFRYLMCNRKFEEVTGVSRNNIIGNFDKDIFKLDEAAANKFRQDDQKVVNSGEMLEDKEQFTNVNGKTYTVLIVKNSVTRSNGTHLLVGMGVDISRMHELEQEQLRTIEALNNYIDTERIVNESLKSITLENDFNTAIKEMLRAIGKNTGADSCYIFRYHDDKINRFSPEFEWIREGYPSQMENFQNSDMSAAQSWLNQLLDHEDIMITDTANPPEGFAPEAQFMAQVGIRSVIASGIWINDKLSGFVSITFMRSQKNFTGSDIGAIHNITNIYLLALERDRRLKEIVESQQIKDQFFDSVAMPVMQFSVDYDIIAVNPMTVEVSGKSEAELIGQKCYKAFCNCDAPPDWCPMQKTLETKTVSKIDYESYGRQFIIAIQPVFDSEGNIIYVLETAHDISDVKAMESERGKLLENLQTYADQERLLNSVLENITVTSDDDAAMQEILQTMTRHLGGYISYVFRTDFELGQDIPVAAYHMPGVQETEALPPLPIEYDAKWFKIIRETGIFEVPVAGTPEANEMQGQWAPYMEPLGIKSLFGAGIWIDHEFWGYMVFLFNKPLELNLRNKALLKASAHLVEIMLERRRNRADLSRSEYEKRLIIDTLKIPVLLFDKNRTLVRVNNAALEIAGISEEEIYARPCYKSFCGDEKLFNECAVAKAFHDCVEHSMFLTINGRDYHASSHPIIIDGKLVNILETLIDVTEFNAIQKQLTGALTEAQDANKAKSYFLATMSHEIRTPLNAVIGFSALLQNNELPKPEQLEYLESINLAGNALLGLINDVLDLSKLEADRMTIVAVPADLNKLFKEIFSVFQYKVQEKKLALLIESDAAMPILKVDSARLRQVLLNLIGNAVKFTEQGSIILQVTFIPAGSDRGRLTIAVKDTGIGITPEAMKKIFQPFFQQDAVRDSVIYKGTGLGLAISGRLVNNMGGAINVASEIGVGSTFTIDLPEVFIGELAPEQTLIPQEAVGDKPLKVLIVDDVPLNLKVLSAMLKKLKVESISANSALEALEIVKKEKFDFVLTDMWMPEITGVQLARMIHKLPGLESLQVVAVTADTEINNSFNLTQAHYMLLKPVSLEKLEKVLSLFREGKLNGIQ